MKAIYVMKTNRNSKKWKNHYSLLANQQSCKEYTCSGSTNLLKSCTCG